MSNYDKQVRDESVMEIVWSLRLFLLFAILSAVAFFVFHSEAWMALLALMSAAMLMVSILAAVASRNML